MSNPWEDIRKEIRKEDAEAERKAFIKSIGEMKSDNVKLADLLQQTGEQMHKEGEANRKAKAEAERIEKEKKNAEAENTKTLLSSMLDKLPRY